ncbi:MAG: DNA polymerase III subunit delta [Verrucomicrobiales bacterium]|nr:DNA polymerase III subunit delta [Verrucomicrobiales bacterium]
MVASGASKPVCLIHGEDDFAVKARARALFDQWSQELGGMDHEMIEGQVSNGGEMLRSLGKLREALHTLPFFGGGKVIWWQNCSFLGDDRTSTSGTVTEALSELAAELAKFEWGSVRLIVSAGKVDKRRSFYKTLDKLGTVEVFASWSDDDNWVARAEAAAAQALRERRQEIFPEALAALVTSVGPQPRQLMSEVEKLSLYVGDRRQITESDVDAIVTRNKQARAFALSEAFGERNLAKALRCLDEEMWEMQFDKDKSEFGLLMGLISKVRSMIGVSELLRLKWLKPEQDWRRYPSQLQRIPPEKLPSEKRFNPAALHPYVLHKTISHCRQYTAAELVRAMESLLACNRSLIFSSLEARLVLQQTLVHILSGSASGGTARGRAAV